MLQAQTPSFFISVRFLFSILFFFGIAIQYIHRIDLSLAIVCMVNHTAQAATRNEIFHDNKKVDEKYCLFQNDSAANDKDGPFDWSLTVQEFSLSAYFYGYMVSQIPGGWLAYRFGPKIVLAISMLIGSIGILVSPICAYWHYSVLILARLVTGLAQGVLWPTMMGTWSRWAPQKERSRLVGFGNSGNQIGSLIGFLSGGYLCANEGWELIFYWSGSVGVVWSIAWYFCTSNTPETHKFMTNEEKNYILKETKETTDMLKENHSKKTPWRAIFSSKAVIILFIAHFTFSFGLTLFLTNAPLYMKDVLKFNIKANGLYSSLPYIAVLITSIASAFLSDLLIKRERISRTNVRKIFNGIGLIPPGLTIIGISFVDCDKPYVAVALLTVTLAFTGLAAGGGFGVMFNEVVGAYSSVVYGISNTIAAVPGIIVPYLVAATTKNGTRSEWQIMFSITATVFIIGGSASTIFGKSEMQYWAIPVKLINSESTNEIPLK